MAWRRRLRRKHVAIEQTAVLLDWTTGLSVFCTALWETDKRWAVQAARSLPTGSEKYLNVNVENA